MLIIVPVHHTTSIIPRSPYPTARNPPADTPQVRAYVTTSPYQTSPSAPSPPTARPTSSHAATWTNPCSRASHARIPIRAATRPLTLQARAQPCLELHTAPINVPATCQHPLPLWDRGHTISSKWARFEISLAPGGCNAVLQAATHQRINTESWAR